MILYPRNTMNVWLGLHSSPVPAITLYGIIGVLGYLMIVSARRLGGIGAGWISLIGYFGVLKGVVNTLITVFAPNFIPNLILNGVGSLRLRFGIFAGAMILAIGFSFLWYTINLVTAGKYKTVLGK